MKTKRSRIPQKIVGYDPVTRKPIYEHRTECQYCNRIFKIPATRANHEYHFCKQNPNVKEIRHKVKLAKLNPKILTTTSTYKVILKTVNQILSNLPNHLQYAVYDEYYHHEMIQMRQAIKWLKTRQLNTIITLLEFQTETITIK